jgi:hypothetical protein
MMFLLCLLMKPWCIKRYSDTWLIVAWGLLIPRGEARLEVAPGNFLLKSIPAGHAAAMLGHLFSGEVEWYSGRILEAIGRICPGRCGVWL